MNIALVVPGGVDRSGEYRVIPALLALIARLAASHDVRVFALHQEPRPGSWSLGGVPVTNIGARLTVPRTVAAVLRAHRERRFDVIQSIWAGTTGLIGVGAARLLRIPGCVHIAGGELVALPAIGYGGGQFARWRVLHPWLLRNAQLVTAASAPILDAAAALGVSAQRVPLGVALDVWPPRAPRARAPGLPAQLIHVASLNRVKDQTTLLRAAQRLRRDGRDFHLHIVGEDTLRGEMQALTARLDLHEAVVFHGFMTQRQLRPLMDAAHIHVVSSRHEAGPVAMLEAAVAGVPTVGTAVGHVLEWAPHAALGVACGNDEALAQAIAQLIDDEPRRLQLARAGFELAVAADADHTARLFTAHYARLRA